MCVSRSILLMVKLLLHVCQIRQFVKIILVLFNICQDICNRSGATLAKQEKRSANNWPWTCFVPVGGQKQMWQDDEVCDESTLITKLPKWRMASMNPENVLKYLLSWKVLSMEKKSFSNMTQSVERKLCSSCLDPFIVFDVIFMILCLHICQDWRYVVHYDVNIPRVVLGTQLSELRQPKKRKARNNLSQFVGDSTWEIVNSIYIIGKLADRFVFLRRAQNQY